MKISSIVGGRNIFTETGVADCDMPLLLSKDTIKKAEMRIDFTKDTVTIFGLKQKLFFNLKIITVFFLEIILKM